MNRIAELRKIVSQYGTSIVEHYTDGPRSGRSGRSPIPGRENWVIYTLDFDPKNPLTQDNEEKLMIQIWFRPDIEKIYFTKNSHRLKVVFNCRNIRGTAK